MGLRIGVGEDIILANGRKVRVGLALASVELDGRDTVVQTLVFNVAEPVIGAFTLEALGLAVDPASGGLKPTRSFITRL